jgi:hypothetical protein
MRAGQSARSNPVLQLLRPTHSRTGAHESPRDDHKRPVAPQKRWTGGIRCRAHPVLRFLRVREFTILRAHYAGWRRLDVQWMLPAHAVEERGSRVDALGTDPSGGRPRAQPDARTALHAPGTSAHTTAWQVPAVWLTADHGVLYQHGRGIRRVGASVLRRVSLLSTSSASVPLAEVLAAPRTAQEVPILRLPVASVNVSPTAPNPVRPTRHGLSGVSDFAATTSPDSPMRSRRTAASTSRTS